MVGRDPAGLIHWTLLDNFEWVFGYEPKLGPHDVDRETFARTPKPSRDRVGVVVSHKCHVPTKNPDSPNEARPGLQGTRS